MADFRNSYHSEDEDYLDNEFDNEFDNEEGYAFDEFGDVDYDDYQPDYEPDYDDTEEALIGYGAGFVDNSVNVSEIKQDKLLQAAKEDAVQQQAETIIDCTDLVVYERKDDKNNVTIVYGLIVEQGKVYVPNEGIIDYGDAKPLKNCNIDTYSLMQRLYTMSKQQIDRQAEIQRLEELISKAKQELDNANEALNSLLKEYQNVRVAEASELKRYGSLLDIESEKAQLKASLGNNGMI